MNIFERLRASEKLQMPFLGDTQISTAPTTNTLQAHVGRWRTLQARAVDSGLLATMLTVGSLTLLVKFVAAGKETFVARQLGVGDALDAFLVAFSLPALAMNVISGSFNPALIPTYIQICERDGEEKGQQFFSGLMFWTCGLLLFASALLALVFPLVLPILASGFNPQKLAQTHLLFVMILPIVTITGLAATWGAILNARGEFALPAAMPLVSSLIIVFALLSRFHIPAIQSLAAATIVGACLEMVILGGSLQCRGISIVPKCSGIDANMKQVMRQYVPLAAAAFVFGGTTLADQSIAARLGPGSVAALSYGSKIIGLILGVSATAVSTAVLPHFSRQVAIGDWMGLRGDLKFYTVLILAALIPLSMLLSFFSVPLVRIAFERGAFTATDTSLVAHVQTCLAPQIPFYTLGLMCLRLTSALKINERVFLLASANVILNFVLDIVFSKFLGIAGIALSTSLVSIFSCGMLYVLVFRALPTVPSNIHEQTEIYGEGWK